MLIALPERLEGESSALRPLRAEDATPYAAAFSDDGELGRLLGVEVDPDEASLLELIEADSVDAQDRRSLRLAIVDPESDAFWGEMMVHSLNDQHRRGEVGFFVVPEQRGRGVASSAMGLTLGWLFGELELLRVEMTTTPDNAIVPALARRLGFVQEGLLRARNLERGQRVDLVWFGLLREEWQAHGSSR